jgi:hypothetical protein
MENEQNSQAGAGQAPPASPGATPQSAGGGEGASVAPQAPALPKGATPAERMRASLAAAKGTAAPGGAAPKGPGTAGDATEAAESADPVAAKVAEVAKRLEAKRAKEAEERASAEQQSEAAQLEAKIAAARLDPELLRSPKGREHLRAWSSATGVDPIALFEALADLGEEADREAKADPLEMRLSKLEQAEQDKAARAAAAAKAAGETRARTAFLATVKPEKFPLLSALDEDEVMARGIAAAKALVAAGEEPDTETIAALAEMKLRELHSKLAAKGSGTTKPAGSAEPRTLSSSLGGETPEPPKLDSGKDGPLNRMKAHMQRMRG